MLGTHAIEHGSSRTGRWLRQHRLRFTLWLAAAEGLLYIVHVLHFWPLVALAVIFVLFFVYAGRSSRSDTLRQVAWILAAAQLLVLLVPVAWAIVKTVAIVVVALIAIAALVFLFTERR
jgi:hypothetical protein